MRSSRRGGVGRWLAVAAALLIVSAPARAQYVVWIDTQYGSPVLRRAGPSFAGAESLALPAGTLPEGVAFAVQSGRLVWAEGAWSDASIRTGPFSLGSSAPLVQGLSCARGIAEDPSTGGLFWTTSNLVTGSSVQRCEFDGSGVTTVLSFGSARNLRGIAVDPGSGRLFLADFDNDEILSANLDGSGLQVVASLGGGRAPYGVAVDPGAQRVYWCEYVGGAIQSADAAGGDVTLHVSGLSHPTWIALDPATHDMYWSEASGPPRLRKGSMSGGTIWAEEFLTSTYGGVAFVPGVQVGAPVGERAPELALAPIAPNPATARARVTFSLPAPAHVRLTLTDVQGRRAATLVDGALAAGRHRAEVAAGRDGIPAGLYFVRLETGGRALTRRMVLLP